MVREAKPCYRDLLLRKQGQKPIQKPNLRIIYEIPQYADNNDGNNVRNEEDRAEKACQAEAKTRERYGEKSREQHNADYFACHQKIIVANRSPNDRIVEHLYEIVKAYKRFFVRHAGPIKEAVIKPLHNRINRKYAEEKQRRDDKRCDKYISLPLCRTCVHLSIPPSKLAEGDRGSMP